MTCVNTPGMGTYGSAWQARGYSGNGSVKELLGSLAGRTAIVCGNGAGVFEELAVAQRAMPDAVIFAANDVGMYLDRLDHWVTLHADNLAAWKTVRWLHHRAAEDTRHHSIDAKPCVEFVWSHLTPVFALSGYFAMQVAWILGAERIVLCGCPGNQTKRFFEASPRQDFGYGSGPAGSDASIKEQVEKEMQRVPGFRNAVRSMGGWTKEYFGSIDG